MIDRTPVAQNSPISSLDPRVRIACAFLTSFCIAPLQGIPACSVAICSSLLVILLSSPILRPLLSRLLAVNSFVLLAAVLLPFTVPDTPGIGVIFSLSPSQKGIHLATLIALKANAIALWFMALMGSMEPATIGYALERLHVPRKLVFLFIFTLRFIHTIGKEWSTLTTSAKLRGFVPRCTAHAYKTTGSLLGVLLLRSNARAKRVHEAMLLRGFNGRFRSVTSFKGNPRDFLFSALVLGLLTLLFLLEFNILPCTF